ncbi:MAG TPA: hypothetical protein VKA30_02030 [Actinomycetota bacterium]|nr:hypothetical protein [Actinomycetota bacterium]
MRRWLVACLVGAVFAITVGQGVAGAFPAAPRANSNVTKVSASTFDPGRYVARNVFLLSKYHCLNVDGDFRWLCLGSATPPVNHTCSVIVGVPGLLTFFRCGPPNLSPPGATCINIDRDLAVTCFFGATPRGSNGTCEPKAGVPGVIVYYRCSGGDQPVRRILHKLPH